MALNGPRLGTTFQQAYEAHRLRITPTDFSTPVDQVTIQASLQQLYSDLGSDVTGEITGNALVLPGISVQVTPSSGTGATTGNGSIE